jgi:hypothetical protein
MVLSKLLLGEGRTPVGLRDMLSDSSRMLASFSVEVLRDQQDSFNHLSIKASLPGRILDSVCRVRLRFASWFGSSLLVLRRRLMSVAFVSYCNYTFVSA